MDFIGIVILIIVAILFGLLIFNILKKIIKFALQSAGSLILLFILYVFGVLPINLLTLFIAVIGGILGIVLMVLLAILGVKF